MFSFFKFFGYIAIRSSGNAHAQFDEITSDQYAQLVKDDRLEIVGLREMEVTQTGVMLDTDRDYRFKVGNIDHCDTNYISMKVVSDYDGTLPKDSSEIAVEEQFLIDNGLDIKVGDELTFTQGYRYIDDPLEGFMYLAGNYRSDEKFEAVSQETCKVTAILHDNRATKDWDIIRGLDPGYFPGQ